MASRIKKRKTTGKKTMSKKKKVTKKRTIAKKTVKKKTLAKKRTTRKIVKKKTPAKKRTIKRKSSTIGLKKKKGQYFFDLSFCTENNVPLIYEFVMLEFPKFCTKQGIKELELHIDRLEPLDSPYSNISLESGAIREVLKKFAKSHNMKLINIAGKKKIDLKARISPKNLSKILIDYNKLFDIFYTDTRIEGKGIGLDIMDFVLNSALVYGDLDKMISLQKSLIEKGMLHKVRNVTKYEKLTCFY